MLGQKHRGKGSVGKWHFALNVGEGEGELLQRWDQRQPQPYHIGGVEVRKVCFTNTLHSIKSYSYTQYFPFAYQGRVTTPPWPSPHIRFWDEVDKYHFKAKREVRIDDRNFPWLRLNLTTFDRSATSVVWCPGLVMMKLIHVKRIYKKVWRRQLGRWSAIFFWLSQIV